MENTKFSTLIEKEKIIQRTEEIGKALTQKFKGKTPIVLSVLNGSFIFYSDLIRNMDLDVICDFVTLTSYGNNLTTTGEVKLTLDLMSPIRGKDIIIVEDIIDSGYSMEFLVSSLKSRGCRSVTIVTLLLKPSSLKTNIQVDYVGFEIADQYVLGYGLDYQGYYRNLPHIAYIDNKLN